MVQMLLTLKVAPAKAPDLIRALRAVTLAGHGTRGCLRVQASRDLGDPDVLYYLEIWQTTEDAVREVRSSRFCRLLELMESAQEPPELQFQFVTEVRGLDYVAEVRRGQHLPAV